MKKLFSTTALALTLIFSGTAHAAPSTTAEPPSYIDNALASLPKNDANNFRDTMGDAHEQNKDLYDQIHQVHEDLHTILTAQSFDEDAFIAKSAELRKLHTQIGDNIDAAFADAVSNLSTKERMKFADALEANHMQHAAATQQQQQ